jgi:hypothetical protein
VRLTHEGEEKREVDKDFSSDELQAAGNVPVAVLQATTQVRWRGAEREQLERGCARLELGFYREKEGGKASAGSKGHQWPRPLSQSREMP